MALLWGVCPLLLLLPAPVPALEPLSTAALMAGGAVLIGLYKFNYHCHFLDCCHEQEVPNLSALQLDLALDVYGQPLATSLVLQALKKHWDIKHPSKPLVLSFHGGTGTGKSFLSNIIVKNMYEKGAGSPFVHMFDAFLHFPHAKHLPLYKVQLHDWVQGNLSSCPRSIFIFSEMDKMPHGLIDAISPFLSHRKEKSYGKAIFIFQNNVGSRQINKVALDFWKRNIPREEIRMKDLELELAAEAFKSENSGFWNSHLMQKNLIDYFVPFLPLEWQHVELCLKAELQSRGYTQDPALIQKILHELINYPEVEKIYFRKGCKTISSRLDHYS